MIAEPRSARWFKSSYSSGGQECVEVAFLDSAVGVRDSKRPGGPVLVFEEREWGAFAAAVAEGRFDAPGV
ncbi:DUF397 domain-containing protein [Nocardia sp. NBC_01503]|uniref:DUF397 domain-containing protein n=1 Tax=Nocardia sp. NBC_01503 TaxID=2975997 RepID=UPI002E7B24B1|nr:DUF397 domain-containing protein [Nocardia sp. NBC_01503]WTL29980.1 DUF397 domain-containing protein [Nocardia sp. NBC_01503]